MLRVVTRIIKLVPTIVIVLRKWLNQLHLSNKTKLLGSIHLATQGQEVELIRSRLVARRTTTVVDVLGIIRVFDFLWGYSKGCVHFLAVI